MSRRPPVGRLRALLALLVLALLGVGTRVSVLQLRDAERYVALARDQRVREIDLPAERGGIFDRTGHELAISSAAKAVWADPTRIENPRQTAAKLAEALEMPRRPLLEALRQDGSFVYLARRLDLGVAERVERLDLPGIGLLDETKRYYPAGDLVPQVLGFVGVDGAGLAGVELAHDDFLAGTPGKLVDEQDPAGRSIPQGFQRRIEPVPGGDLVLTIDRDLAFQAQRALRDAVRANGGKGGTIIILDPSNGDVLTMATYPWFDANAFTEARPAAIRNRAVTDVYEPGSVNKVITAAAALEEGVIRSEERIEVPDTLQVGDKLFQDVHPHPPAAMTISDIIAESSNVGTIRVAERLGRDRLATWLDRFGFGRNTGIGFPAEARGILLPRDQWWVTSMGTIPLGQGIAVTPLQMALVYSTIANDGIRVQPRLVRGTIDGNGRFQPAPVGRETRVVSKRTARRLRAMLVRVVEEGTGQLARVPGYRIAGKTGTARKPLDGARGYGDEYVASFIGLAPAEDPRIVVAAIIDEPDTIYGGVAAAPLFREVVRFALADLHVPPSEPA